MRKGFHGKGEVTKRCRNELVLWTGVRDPSCRLSENMLSISKRLQLCEGYDRNAVNLDCPSIERISVIFGRERGLKRGAVGLDLESLA
jgi:hypothetical protein